MKLFGCALVLLGCCVYAQGWSFSETVLKRFVRTSNVDTAFGRWDRSRIPYCLDSTITAAETTAINTALATLNTAMKSCFTFVAVACPATEFHIKFTIPTGTGIAALSSSSPGRLMRPATATPYEQTVNLARDASLCSTTPRCILRYLANVLGKRNEHQRGDRTSYITVVGDSLLRTPEAYRMYNKSQAYWELFPGVYDYCSITHNQQTDYALSGNAFTFPANAPMTCIPALQTLSYTDCLYLDAMHQCPNDCDTTTTPQCTASLCTGGSTTTTTTTTSATTTAGLCAVNFCATPTPRITEAAILFNDKYYMFSGDCMIEIDNTNKLVTGARSTKISSILSGVTGPVVAAWTDQMSKTTYVQTSATAQYACTPSTPPTPGTTSTATTATCYPVQPKNNLDIEFEYSGSQQGPPFGLYRFTNAAKMFTNEYSGVQKAFSTITCTAPCTTAAITGDWVGAYLSKGAGGQNSINVIGLDASSNQVMQSMTMTAADTFGWSNAAVQLNTVLNCAAAGGGTGA